MSTIAGSPNLPACPAVRWQVNRSPKKTFGLSRLGASEDGLRDVFEESPYSATAEQFWEV